MEKLMLEFTNEQVSRYIIGTIIFAMFYMLIYHKYGIRKSVVGYVQALISTLVYSLVFVFSIVGAGLVKEVLMQKQYTVMVIPVAWVLIMSCVIVSNLKKDFGIEDQNNKEDYKKKKH